MYGYCEQHHFFEICRLMIDHKYQGNGYGKMALLQVIEEMRTGADCHKIFLSFESKNLVAKQLYESIGFEDAGRMIEGECLYKLLLKKGSQC